MLQNDIHRALEKQDIVGPLIRNLGAVLVKGYRARDVAMQYMARAGGPTPRSASRSSPP